MFLKKTRKTVTSWPKKIPEITSEQKVINDDWQKYFHKINKKKFSNIVDWGHKYIIKNSPTIFTHTLEIGPGLGEHLKYEKLSEKQKNNYIGIELRENMAKEIKKNYPFVKILVGDCQKNIDYPNNYFDRIIAIHLLEHLPNLPMFLTQAHRLLSDRGTLQIIIPCEGGLGYTIGRNLTTKKMFEKRYKVPYKDFIDYEHVNKAKEILAEIEKYFIVKNRKFYPLKIPIIATNLIIGLTLSKKMLNS